MNSGSHNTIIGYELRLSNLDIDEEELNREIQEGKAHPNALIATVVESIQEISEIELLNRVKEYVKAHPHEDEETHQDHLDKLQDMLVNATKKDNPDDN